MDKYIELKSKLDTEYIYGDDVASNYEVISLFDLLLILEDGFESLRKVKDGSSIIEKINNGRTFFQRVNVFKKKKLIDKKCTSAISTFDKKRCCITFGFENYMENMHEFVVLVKDRDSDELYFQSKQFTDKEFATKYVSEIYGMFAVLEEYALLFSQNENGRMESLNQTFDDGTLSITIEVYLNGKVNCTIVPSKGVDPDKVFDREWLSREKLSTYVAKNNVDILHSIPVSVTDLNESYRCIVEKSFEKDFVKTLTKNNN